MKMPFGKHKNQELADVPESYLRWALRDAEIIKSDPILREAIRLRLGLPPEAKAEHDPDAAGKIARTVREAVRDVYREASMQWHPDLRGGSNDAMIAVNAMHERLQDALSRRLPGSGS
jgi:hypothetical protein